MSKGLVFFLNGFRTVAQFCLSTIKISYSTVCFKKTEVKQLARQGGRLNSTVFFSQKDQGKTASTARILFPNPTRRPLPCHLIKSFFCGKGHGNYYIDTLTFSKNNTEKKFMLELLYSTNNFFFFCCKFYIFLYTRRYR